MPRPRRETESTAAPATAREKGRGAEPGNPYRLLEEALDFSFKEHRLLERALTHRSLTAGSRDNDYERLEYLGDAVVDLAVAHLLLEQYPRAREGELSKMRAALVNTSSLAEIARSCDLSRYVRLSRGESASGGANRPSILADVLEAILGAIYRSAGYDDALRCVRRLFGAAVASVQPTDPKTELQEFLHTQGLSTPEYLLECVEGPEHAPTFVSIVQIDNQVAGRGRGPTKKASQQQAAAAALEKLQQQTEVKPLADGS